MRKIFRKLTACLIAISLPCFTLGLTKVDAKENVVFAKNMEQGKILKKYLEIQKEKHVSGLKKNIEKKFNEQGVLDTEIENFEKDDINRINQSDEIYIYTEYVAVDEKENTSHIMNQKEIDQLIEEKYEDDIKQYTSENGFLYHIGTFTGVVPENVSAATRTNYSDSGCFKKTIIITQARKGNYRAHVSAYFTWITEPAIRAADCMSIFFSGAEIVDNTNATCKYYYTWTDMEKEYTGNWKYLIKDKKMCDDYTKDMKARWNIDAGLTSYAIACVDLKDDYSFTTIDYKRKFVVTNHYIVMQMDVVKDGNDRSRYFTSQTKYYHQQFLVTLDPKVSIDTSGKVSFSGMLSKDKYMHSMGSVLTYQYIWK